MLFLCLWLKRREVVLSFISAAFGDRMGNPSFNLQYRRASVNFMGEVLLRGRDGTKRTVIMPRKVWGRVLVSAHLFFSFNSVLSSH